MPPRDSSPSRRKKQAIHPSLLENGIVPIKSGSDDYGKFWVIKCIVCGGEYSWQEGDQVICTCDKCQGKIPDGQEMLVAGGEVIPIRPDTDMTELRDWQFSGYSASD